MNTPARAVGPSGHREERSGILRRVVLKKAAALCGVVLLDPSRPVAVAQAPARFRIGACDWSLGQRGRTEALPVAARLGLDGVQISMGSVERELICEFHAKENGSLLGQGRIDFAAVRKAMDDIGYSGWIQIEGAIPKGQPMLESHLQNVRFMRAHFGA